MQRLDRMLFACVVTIALVGPASASVRPNRPPLYIVSMMHAEEKPYFMNNETAFRTHADHLRELTELFAQHDAKLAFQPDWTFIEGAKKWDPDLFTWLLDQGMGVDAHAHGKNVPLEGVADRLKECGVGEVRVGNGDFNKRRLFGTNLFWPFAQPWKATGKPYFEAICAYKDAATGAIDRSRVAWRPRLTGGWHVHDPTTPIVYIGGLMCDLKHPDQIPPTLHHRRQRTKHGYVNVLYWHDSLHKYEKPGPAKARMRAWRELLTNVIDPLAETGEVRWATFSEILDAYLALEQSGASALQPGEVIPQILGPGTPRPAGLGGERPAAQAVPAH